MLAVGGEPGEPYEVSPWEANFAALPLRPGAATGTRRSPCTRPALAEHPEHPSLLYNLACMESRAGRHVDALVHLRRSVELDPKYAGYARSDTDFASIRNEQGFPG